MRPIQAVLASLLLVASLTAALGLRQPDASGEPSLALGWALGVAIILFAVSLMWLGGAAGDDRARLRRRLFLVLLLHLAAWTWMVLEYRAYAGGAVDPRLFGLPRPTAVLLFAFWPVSLGYSALFVLGFDRWVLTEDERRRFRQLVDRSGRR